MSQPPGPYSGTLHLTLEWLGYSPSHPQPSSTLDFSKTLENECAVLSILVYVWVCALVLRIEGDVKIAVSATLSVQKMKPKWKGCLQRGCHITRLVLKPPESCGVSREKPFSDEDFLLSWIRLAGCAFRSEQQCLADGGLWPKGVGLQLWGSGLRQYFCFPISGKVWLQVPLRTHLRLLSWILSETSSCMVAAVEGLGG